MKALPLPLSTAASLAIGAVGFGAIGSGAQARAQEPVVFGHDPLAEGSIILTALTGWQGSDSGTDLDLISGRVGLGYAFRDRFEVVGELDVGYYDQTLGSGSRTSIGLGLSGLVRWHVLRGRGWSAFLEGGLGFVASEEAVPSGGSRLNGTRQAGVGVAFDVGERWRLTVGVRQEHLSNGGGLGPNNPTWDGFGGYLGLALDLTPEYAPPGPQREYGLTPPWVRSTRIEGRLGEVGDETAGGAAVTFDSRLVANLHGQVRAGIDIVDSDELLEAGVALYLRGERGLFGLALDHQDLNAFEDDELTAFTEFYANDLVTVTGALGSEWRSDSANRVVGGVALRFYLLEGLMLEGGIAARDPLEDLGADSIEVPLGIEYSPRPLRELGLSLFAEDGLNDNARVVGLRWTLGGPWGESGSLRDRDRSAGPRRTHF
ncbi:acyloxyacyl hydrolase [Engelhardtia mirabilis]|uniref:Lipid A 3-O-deacylase (PagL) n=1 Tax=Engelhardtia mirabilis TaxID=2528011 RepID=A0A518BEE1_9BACT|nr:Lipid A 3-O-deacylase (PagL) [Planctomycetes bacterium Pla133]QDU99662.1 Lipid A 3-O-deacylase (PagL) [Planctomycetes bacterium Pla86]